MIIEESGNIIADMVANHYAFYIQGTIYFNHEKMLADLLFDDILFVNERSYTDSRDQVNKTVALYVNMNDIFCPGSDAEDLPLDEVANLWMHWKRDTKWGPAIWCAKLRKCQPWQRRIENMKRDNAWTEELENLPKNNI